ncbi:MAG TPA: hypothetical protein V6C78_25545 [Crinalium sp.]
MRQCKNLETTLAILLGDGVLLWVWRSQKGASKLLGDIAWQLKSWLTQESLGTSSLGGVWHLSHFQFKFD